MSRFPQRIWLAAFIVAWAVDFLFWGKSAGISFLIFVVITLAAGFVLAGFEKARPVVLSLLLSVVVIFLAGATLVRAEPFSRFLNGFLALVGMALLVRTFQTGGWVRFRIFSYLGMWIDLLVAMLAKAAGLPLAPRSEKQGAFRGWLRGALPWLRGILLALPVVILLAALLASADLVFADQLDSLLKIFALERLPEYLLRFFLILAMTYLLAGLFLQVVKPTRWAFHLPGDEMIFTQPDLAPAASPSTPEGELPADRSAAITSARFLGATEAFIVLGSVNLLFAFFTAIQFRYLFGGRANITAAGYTYSEYARRGFFELVSVAVISLLIYLVLNAVARRGTVRLERVFTFLSVLLVGQVLVILVSAFQRLLLYENAYGFTRLRMYTHIFIPWLGFLLVAVILLQIFHRDQFFGAALLAAVFGFSMCFVVLNVDGMIARQNVARARAGMSLDGAYLVSLSDDALPYLVRSFREEGQAPAVREVLGGVLACRVYRQSKEQPQPWQSYHPGSSVARRALAEVDLSSYPLKTVADEISVDLPDGPFQCYPPLNYD